MTVSRRDIVRAVSAAGLLSGVPRLAFAQGPSEKKLVVVLLRGAMDGLFAVPASGDPDYERARAGMAVKGARPLDATFGLHPNLEKLHARYGAGEVIVFHAIASPYRDRSHFDGQNVLETGAAKPYGLPDGWLNRALLGLPDNQRRGRQELAVALAPSTPLIVRGKAPVTSWSPSILPGPDADLVGRVQALYAAHDPVLAEALKGAAMANGITGEGRGGMGAATPRADLEALMAQAARFLSQPNGPCCAVIDIAGWDTHANQAGAYGALPRNLASLDRGLDALATGLGPRWKDTAVLVMTEFGRTVAQNGTAGTDHGTAGAAFLLGGAVKGGRVVADWPGLSHAALLEGRDLKPTSDLDGVIKGVLVAHMGVEPAYLDRAVFPEIRTPITHGLIRA